MSNETNTALHPPTSATHKPPLPQGEGWGEGIKLNPSKLKK